MEIMRESIFLSSMRSFFKAFGGIFGIFFALIPIFFFIAFFSAQQDFPEKHTIVYLPDAHDTQTILPPKTPVLLRIDIHNEIGFPGNINTQSIESLLVDSRSGILKDRLKGILLHIHSPGGTSNDSDAIYCLLSEYKKTYHIPIYAYVDGICASGAYNIAVSADKIFSSPMGLIGSVGIFQGPFFNFSKAMDKLGIEAKTLTSGKDKDSMNPFRPWTNEEDCEWLKISHYFYQRFVSIVLHERPMMTRKTLVEECGAHVFPAPLAKKYGFIDNANCSYKEAIINLSKAAGVEKEYQMVSLQSKNQWIYDFFRGESSLFKGKMSHEISLKAPECKEQFLYLYPHR